jgi:hypothetical protein
VRTNPWTTEHDREDAEETEARSAWSRRNRRSRFRQLDHQVSISSPLDSGNATKSPTAGTPATDERPGSEEDQAEDERPCKHGELGSSRAHRRDEVTTERPVAATDLATHKRIDPNRARRLSGPDLSW